MDLGKYNPVKRLKEKFQEQEKRLQEQEQRLQEQQQRLQEQQQRLQEQQQRLQEQEKRLQAQDKRLKGMALGMCELTKATHQDRIRDVLLNSDHHRYCYIRRGSHIRILAMTTDVPIAPLLGSEPAEDIVFFLENNPDAVCEFAILNDQTESGPWQPLPGLMEDIKHIPGIYHAFLVARQKEPPSLTQAGITRDDQFHDLAEAALKTSPDLIDFLALGQAALFPELAQTPSGRPPPFEHPGKLPFLKVPAEPKKRSVVFVHNSYYHFNTLATALRKRGWDAVTVSVESPDSPQQQFYTGEDINLYHDDPIIRRQQIDDFFKTVPERFGTLHFSGYASFYQENAIRHLDRYGHRHSISWDLLELRRQRLVIGYTPSGCLDGVSQSAIRKISNNLCSKCIWELHPEVCNDEKNRAWARTIDTVCDWIGLEGDWAVEARTGKKFVHEPVTTALDPDYWHPDIDIPGDKRIERMPGEILVYHAVGNIESRRRNGRDLKGTGAVEAAIATLQQEGLPVRLIFFSKLPILQVRYPKVQADIVIDQLNYGRIGANAREAFMLGCPVITRLDPRQGGGLPPVRVISEAPVLNADETTITDVLRRLALDAKLRKKMSRQSREFALKWFAADVCAERFEKVTDRVAKGLPPETDDLYPPVTTDSTMDHTT